MKTRHVGARSRRTSQIEAQRVPVRLCRLAWVGFDAVVAQGQTADRPRRVRSVVTPRCLGYGVSSAVCRAKALDQVKDLVADQSDSSFAVCAAYFSLGETCR